MNIELTPEEAAVIVDALVFSEIRMRGTVVVNNSSLQAQAARRRAMLGEDLIMRIRKEVGQ